MPVSVLGSGLMKVKRPGLCASGENRDTASIGEIVPGRGVREREAFRGPHTVSSIAGGPGVGEEVRESICTAGRDWTETTP